MKRVINLVLFAALVAGMVTDGEASQLNLVNSIWTGTVGIRSMTVTKYTLPPTFAVETFTSMTVKITKQDGTLFAGTLNAVGPGFNVTLPFTGKLGGDGNVHMTLVDPATGQAESVFKGSLSLVPYSIQGHFQSITSGETGEFKVNRTP
jgi:hypothetical protein